MRHHERPGRPRQRRLAFVTGLALTSLLVVLAATSSNGAGRYGSFTPLGDTGAASVRSVEDQLLVDCLNLKQATTLLSSALSEAGVSGDFEVRTDGGIMSRNEEGAWEAVLAHIDKGCFTYAGAGSDPSGNRVFYFAGPESLAAARAQWASQGD